jgi:Ca-activated chloride channel family protein
MLTLHVQYRHPDSGSRGKVKVAYVDTGNTFAATSDDFKFAAGVAAYGMILRDSPHRGKATLDNAIAWASAGVAKPGDDDTGQRGEIIDLMRRTRALLH